MATTVRRIEDGWELVRDKTSAGAKRFVDLVRDHPLPALTVGLGLGWLVAEGARGHSRLPLPARWRRSGGPAGRSGGEAASGARRGLVGAVEKRPLALGLTSLAIGVLAGVAFPATRREDQLLGETRDGLLESAREAGREALDKSKEVARDAVERVKESVREQELTPEQLAEKARQVARDAAETLRDAERQVVHGVVGGAPDTPPPDRIGTPPRL
jgi:hypothetical protein